MEFDSKYKNWYDENSWHDAMRAEMEN